MNYREHRAPREDSLLAEVKTARAEYEGAKKQHDELMQIAGDLGVGHPEGATAIRNALHCQQLATERYARALRALTELVLGKAKS